MYRRHSLLLITLAIMSAACAEDRGSVSPPAAEAPASPAEEVAPRTPGPECEKTSELVAIPSEEETSTGQSIFAWDPTCIVTSDTSITVTDDDDNLHSFTISGSDIDVDIKPGKTETIDLSGATDPDGETYFVCTYHHLMDGYVWVV
jgi:hypothetical protein